MKTKRRSPQEIISQINALLQELASLPVSAQPKVSNSAPATTEEKFTGPSGGIKLLLKEGFFAAPKTQPEVLVRLRQEGYNYTASVVAVALLRMVRARVMVRLPFPGEGKEKWSYAERK